MVLVLDTHDQRFATVFGGGRSSCTRTGERFLRIPHVPGPDGPTTLTVQLLTPQESARTAVARHIASGYALILTNENGIRLHSVFDAVLCAQTAPTMMDNPLFIDVEAGLDDRQIETVARWLRSFGP